MKNLKLTDWFKSLKKTKDEDKTTEQLKREIKRNNKIELLLVCIVAAIAVFYIYIN